MKYDVMKDLSSKESNLPVWYNQANPPVLLSRSSVPSAVIRQTDIQTISKDIKYISCQLLVSIATTVVNCDSFFTCWELTVYTIPFFRDFVIAKQGKKFMFYKCCSLTALLPPTSFHMSVAFGTPYNGTHFISLTLFLNVSAIWPSEMSNGKSFALPMFVLTAEVSVSPNLRLEANIDIFVPSFFFDTTNPLTVALKNYS